MESSFQLNQADYLREVYASELLKMCTVDTVAFKFNPQIVMKTGNSNNISKSGLHNLELYEAGDNLVAM